MSTDEKLDRVLALVEQLVAVLVAKPAIPAKIDVTREEVMAMLGFAPHETVAFYQVAHRLGLKPYREKHYRLRDVEERVARATFKRQNRDKVTKEKRAA